MAQRGRGRPAGLRALSAAEIGRAAARAPAAVLYGHTIYLPGHRELAAAVGREVFMRCCTRFPRLRRSYVLMTLDSPVVQYAQWGRIPAPDDRDRDGRSRRR